MKKIKELEELIKKNRLEEFCEKILEELDKLEQSTKNNELIAPIKKDVFTLSSNLHGILNMNRQNIIDLEQYSISKSRVISGLLDVLKEYKLIKGNTWNKNLTNQVGGVLISNKISEPIGIIYGLSGYYNGNIIFVSSKIRKLTFGWGNDYLNTESDVFISIDDILISRTHFMIRIKPIESTTSNDRSYEWKIFDLVSTNGTFVNGRQIRRDNDGFLLSGGDVIHIGDNRLQIKMFK